MAELLALGISHKTAPLELRERVALTEGRATGVLRELVQAPEVQEAAAISTCNRTELYMAAPGAVGAESLALGVLAREAGTPPTELVGHLYSLRGADAALHLFRVTAGLDSMILGEAEVQGQVKRAYELALVERADIVVASTGSPHHVIEREALSEVMRAREGRALLLIDLAVPRDIHPDCRGIEGVSLYDMDDLQALVERNASGREAEARKAESVLRAELARFERWLAAQDVVPTVAALRERADEIVSRVLAENEPRWESL